MALTVRHTGTRAAAPVVASRSRASAVKCRAALEPTLVIPASTAALLAVGRFAFLPYQRKTNKAAAEVSAPKTDGTTYFDSLQKDASFITTTSDPDGFNLIDVFAWGALGHALGFAVLAASSSGTIPGVAGP